MKNWTIRQRVIASFALILSLMMVMAALAIQRLARIGELTDSLTYDSMPGLKLSSEVRIRAMAVYATTQEHVISADPAAMQRLERTLEEDRAKLRELLDRYGKTMVTDRDRQLFATMRSALEPFTRVQAEVLSLSRQARNQEANEITIRQLKAEFDNVQRAASALLDYNTHHADSSAQLIASAVSSAMNGIVVSGVVALMLALLCGFLLLRAVTTPLSRLVQAVEVLRTGDLTGRVSLAQRDEFAALSDGFNRMTEELGTLVGHIQKWGIQVNASATEIAASAKEQQATAAETAATTTEIGATSREISATSRELVKTMNEVAGFAEHSAELAGRGHENLTEMEGTMDRVMAATGTVNGKLAVLNDKAANIGQVVTVIARVADQTNLLSLNAAIEAEKAGEYGRGFSVVATEIRRLADQTAAATGDIEQMVKEIQSAISAGVMGMDRFSEEVGAGIHGMQQVGAQLALIIQQVQALAPRCEAVSEGMKAQSTGAEQITQALTQLSEASQQTVDSLRQSTMATADLNQLASSLRGAISRFRVQS